MAKRRKRRVWSDDEKRMICAQTRVPGISVSQVARRYDVNANQVFSWLKDPRFSSDEVSIPEQKGATRRCNRGPPVGLVAAPWHACSPYS